MDQSLYLFLKDICVKHLEGGEFNLLGKGSSENFKR